MGLTDVGLTNQLYKQFTFQSKLYNKHCIHLAQLQSITYSQKLMAPTVLPQNAIDLFVSAPETVEECVASIIDYSNRPSNSENNVDNVLSDTVNKLNNILVALSDL